MQLPPPPWIVAHRGALPLLENTIPALLLAVAEGADMLEFDVQATADGALVVHHDADLARLAGRPDLVVESTAVGELVAQELRHPQDPARHGRIPTLAALLAALPDDFPVNVELKVKRGARGRLAELALAATAGRRNVLISSFDTAVLSELRRRSATVRLAPIAGRWTPGLERLGSELGAWSLHVGAGVANARGAGPGAGQSAATAPPVLVFTVNAAARARALLAQGAAGLFTDRPGGLRTELGQPGGSGVLFSAYRGR